MNGKCRLQSGCPRRYCRFAAPNLLYEWTKILSTAVNVSSLRKNICSGGAEPQCTPAGHDNLFEVVTYIRIASLYVVRVAFVMNVPVMTSDKVYAEVKAMKTE